MTIATELYYTVYENLGERSSKFPRIKEKTGKVELREGGGVLEGSTALFLCVQPDKLSENPILAFTIRAQFQTNEMS